MTKRIDPNENSLYLLHFDEPVGNARHYLGITKTYRLRERLQRHVRGFGASLTYRARAQGVNVYLAHTIPDASYRMERQLKRSGHLKNMCPICLDPARNWSARLLKTRPIEQAKRSNLKTLDWISPTPQTQPTK